MAGSLNEYTNICIIGHNYFDNRFFSNLNKLEVGDIIVMYDLENNKYEYTIYSKYEVDENNINDVIRQEYYQELTLVTCTIDRNKRLVIKAIIKN